MYAVELDCVYGEECLTERVSVVLMLFTSKGT